MGTSELWKSGQFRDTEYQIQPPIANSAQQPNPINYLKNKTNLIDNCWRLLACGKLTPEVLKRREHACFVFADNARRAGTAGQATVRGLENAIGVATKWAPSMVDTAFFRDQQEGPWKILARDLAAVRRRLEAGDEVVWPADGIGTGLARMGEHCPRLYEKLCVTARDLFRDFGQPTASVVVCGGEEADKDMIERALSAARLRELPIHEVIERGNFGTDEIAGEWAGINGVRTSVQPDWERHGKAAGPKCVAHVLKKLEARRQQAGVEVAVIAFPGGRESELMIEQAFRVGITVLDGAEIAAAAENSDVAPSP
ncbi:SLOG family protein [Amorphus sp. 3PC139-8]|uniref:DUF7831 domain-containing protein n=1 Tax=Amorphus sp. 3PC139-8 TaxID=2735676 RepID=UPI00345C69EF